MTGTRSTLKSHSPPGAKGNQTMNLFKYLAAWAAVLLAMAFAAPSFAQTLGDFTSASDGKAQHVQGVQTVGGSFTRMSTATTITAKSGAGYFHAISVNTCVANATITIYDNTAASGTVIGLITCPATVGNAFTLIEDVKFSTGLTIITSGATDLTVSYL